MGATAIRAMFRSSRVMTKMMTEEAEKLDVTDGAWRYTRISGSKERGSREMRHDGAVDEQTRVQPA
jgi:hypothetical protein